MRNMVLNLCSFTNSGATVGNVRIDLQFGSRKWTVPEDPFRVWARVAHQSEGPLEVVGDSVAVREYEPGGDPVLTLSYVPPSDTATANAGSGSFSGNAVDPVLRGAHVFWTFESPTFSPIRAAMLELLVKTVPPGGLTSDMAAFRTLTGYDTARIKREYWENPDRPNLTFTCCNLFLGAMANRLGSVTGKKPGRWLAAGVLQLDKVDIDVPGCWIKASEGDFPKPGDFFSLSGYNQNHDFQLFKHVGIVGKVDNGQWTTVDGGQGARPHYDAVKWTDRGVISKVNLNGWVDIDRYFR